MKRILLSGVLAAMLVSGLAYAVAGSAIEVSGGDSMPWWVRLSVPPQAYVITDTSQTTVNGTIGFPAATSTAGGGITATRNYGRVSVDLLSGAVNGDAASVVSSGSVLRFNSSAGHAVVRSFLGSLGTSSVRHWPVALSSTNTLPANNSINAAYYCGIRYSTSVPDSGWVCCSSDGTTASCGSSFASFAANINYYEVEYDAGVSCTCRIYDGPTGTLTASTTKTNNVTAPTGGMLVLSSSTTLTNAAVTLRLAYLGIE